MALQRNQELVDFDKGSSIGSADFPQETFRIHERVSCTDLTNYLSHDHMDIDLRNVPINRKMSPIT